MTYKNCTVTILEYTFREGEIIPVTTSQEGHDSEGNIEFTDDSEIGVWSGILAMKDILEAKMEGFPIGYLFLEGVKTRVIIQETDGEEPDTLSLEYREEGRLQGTRLTWEISREILEDMWCALTYGPTWAFFS